jgi:hypothetical protein
MSRNFEVQVETFPCTAESSTAVAAVLRQWGMEIEGDVENFDDNYADDGWCWWGSLQLVGGQTEKEKHAQLVALLPQAALTTRWRWVDELPWDSEFTSEPSIRVHPAA